MVQTKLPVSLIVVAISIVWVTAGVGVGVIENQGTVCSRGSFKTFSTALTVQEVK